MKKFHILLNIAVFCNTINTQRATFEDSDVVIEGRRGNMLPPPETGYFDQYDRCGQINQPGYNNTRPKRSMWRPPMSATDYILRGDDVDDQWFPWVGRLQQNVDTHIRRSKLRELKPTKPEHFRDAGYKADWRHLCTLVLISSRHVLTGLHCFDVKYFYEYDRSFNDIPYSEMRVVFGDDRNAKKHRTTHFEEIQTETLIIRNIIKLHVAPSNNGPHDLALVEIREINLTNNFRPICLPLNGIPISGPSYTIAGYGFAGANANGKKFYKDKLQVLRGINVEKKDTRPKSVNLVLEGQKTIKLLGYNRRRVVTTNYFYAWIDKTGSGNLNGVCAGDFGGPVMWSNPNFGFYARYYLIGIVSATDARAIKDCQRLPKNPLKIVAAKVPNFMEWLVKTMSPIAAQQNICLPDACKTLPDPTRRTWMYIGASGAEKLAAPCTDTTDGTFICPVDMHAYRRKQLLDFHAVSVETYQQEFKWRYCKPCSELNSTQLNWKVDNYLNEITAGSFIQHRYRYVTLVEDYYRNKLPDPDSGVNLPYQGLCDVNAEDSFHVSCPFTSVAKSNQISTGECILTENLCDGHNDCADGWDESPHLCIGKCDYYKQFQAPSYTYVQEPDRVQSYNIFTPEACHQRCLIAKKVVGNTVTNCTHFQWFGKENNTQYSIAHVCVLMFDYARKDKDRAVEIATDKEEYVVRGPRECPGMFIKDYDDIPDQIQCAPVNGIPFRSGFYLIQTYNGQFLEYSGTLNITDSTYEEATRIETPYTSGLTSKKSEWILKFHDASSYLYDNYFTISPGYGDGPRAAYKFLTLTRKSGGVAISLSEDQTGHNPYYTQRWHMEPTRHQRGHTEVKIYAKLAGSSTKHFLIVPDGFFTNHPEYHVIGRGQASDHDVNSEVPIETQTRDYTDNLRQTFRLLECDYGLDTGAWIRKVRRKEPAWEDETTLIQLLRTAFGNPITLPLSGTIVYPSGPVRYISPNHKDIELAGQIFKNLFGLSNARFYHMRKQIERGVTHIPRMIARLMGVSTSIFDYAGKMRIKPKQFEIMFNTWKTIVENWKDTLCIDKSNGYHCIKGEMEMYAYFKKKLSKGFLSA